MNSIKKLQNAQALSVSAENSYSEDKLMNMFLDNFHQGGTYIAHIARHQVELRREGNLTYRKYLSITFLQTDYLNLDRSSGSGRNNERENIVNTKWNFCGGTNHYEDTCFKKIIKTVILRIN